MVPTEPAFSPISPDDHRGYLWIAAILSLIFISLTLSARLYVRKHMLGLDDYASIAAAVLAVAQYISIFVGLPLGIGTSKAEVAKHERTAGGIFLASEVLFVAGLYMAKLAVLLTTERLLALNMHLIKKICLVDRVILGLGAIASVLVTTIGCSSGGLLLAGSKRHCSAQSLRWTALSVVDGVTELCILCTFYWIVWALQMSKKLKLTLTILLGLRILCPILTGIYTSALASYASSSDPAVRIIIPLVWQQAAIGYSLISALLVALMPFLKSFHTGMILDVQNITTGSGGRSTGRSAGQSHTGNYPLRDLDRSKNRSVVRSAAVPEEPLTTTTTTTAAAAAANGGHMNIQKTVDWSVQYEDSDSR